MKLYLDMDNCLTDFNKAVQALGDQAAEGLSEEATEDQKQVMYDAIEKAGEDFWAKMSWKEDGKKLWELVQPFKPVLLSSPGLFRYAKAGKIAWVLDNIPGTPLFLTDRKSEYVDPYDTSILIDDMQKNISAWEECGGIGIKHTSTENTEKILMDLLSDSEKEKTVLKALWTVPEIDPSLIYWS